MVTFKLGYEMPYVGIDNYVDLMRINTSIFMQSMINTLEARVNKINSTRGADTCSANKQLQLPIKQ